MSQTADNSPGQEVERRQFLVPPDATGTRIDQFLALNCDGYSRVWLRRVISQGGATVDGSVIKPSFRVQAGQQVVIDLPPPPTDGPTPEPIPLDILYEDAELVVVNKPAGMVVHPAKGHWSGTLTAALAHHFQVLSDIGGPSRPGIVHRLDRDTSGVLVVAKTNAVHLHLSSQFEQRSVEKQYLAIVVGTVDRDQDVISQPIGPHPYQRDKMAIRSGHPESRPAETRYRVAQRFAGFSLLEVFPKTGRTHQIRVHLTHAGIPILCDRLYAGHARITRCQLLRKYALQHAGDASQEPPVLSRHALHAQRLSFSHPRTSHRMVFEAPLPDDFEQTLAILSHPPE